MWSCFNSILGGMSMFDIIFSDKFRILRIGKMDIDTIKSLTFDKLHFAKDRNVNWLNF